MARIVNTILAGLLLLTCSLLLFGQQTSTSSGTVPTLVNFTGVLSDGNGKPLTGIVGVSFLLYKEQEGGAPLWMETQNVQPNKSGHYSVMLGSTTSTGLPGDIFVAGEARWLGVQAQGQSEQPRVMLLSVPYALKAGDAATVGGLPPSAFVLAAPAQSSSAPAADSTLSINSSSSAPQTTSNVTTSGGTASTIPMYISATDIENSIVTQTGASAINVNGKLNLPSLGAATSTGGFNSRPLDFVASVFNSSTATAVPQTFQWQTEPASNNTSSASGTLNLLYGFGTASPAETGLKINNKGQFTFATGQKFPGTGTVTGITTASGSGLTGGVSSGIANLSLTKICTANQILQWNGTTWACSTPAAGTITGVTAGTDLTGGGTSGSVTLNVDTTKVVTGVTAGTDLTGGGTGGVLTLNLDTNKVPQLVAANTFTGNQTVNGNVSATGLVTGSAFNIGSNMFASGSYANGNAFAGFAGNSTITGGSNTGIGLSALSSDSLGNNNTASGYKALVNNITGSQNTANGSAALFTNTGGNYNSASGSNALFSNSTGYGNTGSGYAALFSNTTGFFNTAVGDAALNANVTGSNNTAIGVSALSGSSTGSNNTATGYQASYNATGSNNTANGYQALYSATGSNNTASGAGALFSNTTGTYNTASGYQALLTNTTGLGNTGTGYLVLFHNTTGSYNTASGDGALDQNSTGGLNTAGGVQALNQNSTGNYNTAYGASAGATGDGTLITGSNNTLLGYRSFLGTGTLSNATAIGAYAVVSQSNSLVLGSISGVGGPATDTNVGIGTVAPTNPLTVVGNSTYTPVSIQSPNTFGTWMQLANSSSGGATWNVLSAGSGNSEGAGNLAFTNFNGNSTVYIHANLRVDGAISAGTKDFKIDHPLDPSHKYLNHASVESSEMMDIYSGNITTDKRGLAIVSLPDYFEALNRDFRYQLTVIGQFAQAIVQRKISGNRFTIKTNRPGVEVSWQVTGVRHDAYANAHRIAVEEEKPPQEQGHYLHPELFGGSAEMAIGSQGSPALRSDEQEEAAWLAERKR